MFDNLSDNLNKVFHKLKGKGIISEEDVNLAMREVRIALLEADVALPVVKDFISRVKEKAVGEAVVRSVSPAQMVIKIVSDELERTLGSEDTEINLRAVPPAVVMMVGLQGSGKTTSTGKIALRLRSKENKKILMASLDIYRPAAQEQLETLGKQVSIDTLEIIKDQKPIDIAKRALEKGKLEAYDIVMLDTAGRLHIDDDLMQELQDVKKATNPVETLLVADALTGQDAVNVAKAFNEKIGVTGIVLTRVDGDGRGGAALSMREVTGCPIKFLGVGEKLSEIEPFHADRIASRILGMGDIVSLVEKASEDIDQEDAQKMLKKARKGEFNFNDLKKQLQQIKKMGGMGGLMKMMPGMGKIKAKMDEANVDEKVLDQQIAIIDSMTEKERENPKLMNPSRKKRISTGCGRDIQEINKLVKQQKQMTQMMKKLGKMDKKSLMRGGLNNLIPKM
jgi:signal recognition particle subunit SRP54